MPNKQRSSKYVVKRKSIQLLQTYRNTDRQMMQRGRRIRVVGDLGVGCGSSEPLQAVCRGHKASNRVCDP